MIPTPVKRLDIGLKAFYESKRPFGLERDSLQHDSELKDDREIERIITKLAKDEFIEMRHGAIGGYLISYDGVLWYLAGGYEGDLRRKNDENDRLSALEFTQQELDKKNVFLTRLAAAGTIGIVLWELLKYFLFDHHWYFHPY